MKRQSLSRQNAALDHATRMEGGVFADPPMAGFAMWDLELSDGTPLWQVELTPQSEVEADLLQATRKGEAKDREDRIAALTAKYEGVDWDSEDPLDEGDDTPQKDEDEWEAFWCGAPPTRVGRVSRARIERTPR